MIHINKFSFGAACGVIKSIEITVPIFPTAEYYETQCQQLKSVLQLFQTQKTIYETDSKETQNYFRNVYC